MKGGGKSYLILLPSRSTLCAPSSKFQKMQGKISKMTKAQHGFQLPTKKFSFPGTSHPKPTHTPPPHRAIHILLHVYWHRYSSFGSRNFLYIIIISFLVYLFEQNIRREDKRIHCTDFYISIAWHVVHI